MWELKQCDKCRKTFKPYNNKQRLCQNPCTLSAKARTNEEANNAWVIDKKKSQRAKHCDMRYLKYVYY